jgi:hypothetical protein
LRKQNFCACENKNVIHCLAVKTSRNWETKFWLPGNPLIRQTAPNMMKLQIVIDNDMKQSNLIDYSTETSRTFTTINVRYTQLSKTLAIEAADINWKISNKSIRSGNQEYQDWDIWWIDSHKNTEKLIMNSKVFLRVNHFPGAEIFYKKDKLARSIQKLQRSNFISETDFIPKTWVLPADHSSLQSFLQGGKNKKWVVVKPLSRVNINIFCFLFHFYLIFFLLLLL